MTNSSDQTARHSAQQVSQEAAALAAHLQRSGVQWLPNPRPEAAESLAATFERPQAPPVESVVDPSPNVSVESQPVAPAPASPTPAAAPPTGATSLFAAEAGDGPHDGSYPGERLPTEERQAALDLINQQVSVCTRCDVLSSCRKKTVFGEGHVTPRVAFFGEGPGADEDRTGRPFVGRAGELLTRMIQACSFQREEVYILNTVKCRPPGNRNPEPDELSNCREYYQQQLAVLRPEYIVCLGAVSAQELLKSKLSVGRLRGRFHSYFESKVVVTYHPAYLLRNPSAKKATWTDLQMMLRDAGIQVG